MSPRSIVPSKEWSKEVFRPFESLGRQLENLFDIPSTGVKTINTPKVDIRETEKEIEVSVALSGVNKKDINMDLTENSLAISCERREEREKEGTGGYRLKEQSYGRFYRAFTLPATVKPSEAKAEYKDGVLKITMQKQKMDKTHYITIK